MKRNLFFYLYFCVLFGLISCHDDSKHESIIKKEIQKENVVPPMVSNMVRFSEILSIAVKENSDLRSFLKIEALKMMDNDYDIFYPHSKNEIVSNGKSFRDILTEYAKNEEELTGIEESLPLLTIYVPELPSGFNAGTWDTKNEIPCVASTVLENDSTDFYSDGKILVSIKSNEIPGWPTLVVKNNERIRLKNKNITASSLRSSSYNDAYEFIDKAFNGQTTSSLRAATLPASQLSPLLISAYNEMGLDNNYWQRDYIYYGLTKQSGSTGTGYINRRFSERIVSIKFSPDAYYKMSDQAGDPAYRFISTNNSTPDCNLFWTDGKFEIKIDIIINNLSGIGTTITKYFSVSPQDVFDIQYTTSRIMGIRYLYCPTGVTSKEYNPNVDLATWDLESNSFGWKFIISETDDQTTETQTQTMNVEYATNFGMTANGLGKIGLNFGTSAKSTQTNTYTLVTTKGADDLGTIECYFSDPVIKSVSGNNYTLFSRGNPYVEMSIIPVQLY